jgi:hypothetical protein
MKIFARFATLIIVLGLISCQNANVNNGEKEIINKATDSVAVAFDTIHHETKPIKTASADENPAKTINETKLPVKTINSNNTSKYSLRKYENVTEFYRRIAKKATNLCMENNVPPAAILAIAGLESGWNQGYVGQITGNILSLGTRKGDIELPALRLPRLKSSGQILFDSLEIIKYQKHELTWEDRPPSLKKDYRPIPYAGKKYNLAYLKYHPNEKEQAHLDNLNDFVTIFISRRSRIKVYKDARKLMDDLVAEHGKEILLKESTAIQFVNEIGGKLNSFNFRKTWPVKVTTIIKKTGLADLTSELYNNDSKFSDVW